MAFVAYLIGVIIYPLFGNWAWGGGWLAELGHEFGLGHGFVDLGGSGVVHETAGTLALVIAVVLGPRHGRFGRTTPSATAIPGHNVPFIVLGSIVLLISWMSTNGFSCVTLGPASSAALAAVNTLLAATGGLIASFIQSAVQKQRPPTGPALPRIARRRGRQLRQRGADRSVGGIYHRCCGRVARPSGNESTRTQTHR